MLDSVSICWRAFSFYFQRKYLNNIFSYPFTKIILADFWLDARHLNPFTTKGRQVLVEPSWLGLSGDLMWIKEGKCPKSRVVGGAGGSDKNLCWQEEAPQPCLTGPV